MKLHQTKIGVQKEMPREDADDDAHRAAQKIQISLSLNSNFKPEGG